MEDALQDCARGRPRPAGWRSRGAIAIALALLLLPGSIAADAQAPRLRLVGSGVPNIQPVLDDPAPAPRAVNS